MGSVHHDDGPQAQIAAVEVLLCSRADGLMELDCVTAHGSEAGWPCTLRVGLPVGEPWSSAAERALVRWATEGVVVSVELRHGWGPSKVRLSAGGTAILLELSGGELRR